jgi:hypothetical protein
MIKRKPYLPIVIIAGVLLSSVLLTQNYRSINSHILSFLVKAMIFSPLFAIPTSIIAFFVAANLIKNKIREIIMDYLSLSLTWAVYGVGIAFALVIFFSIIEPSPQTPLAFILYGPLGLSTGILVGTWLWVTSVLPNKSVQ